MLPIIIANQRSIRSNKLISDLSDELSSNDIAQIKRINNAQSAALCGDIIFSLASAYPGYPDGYAIDGYASAALLNSMSANTVTFDVVVQLKDSDGYLHSWANFMITPIYDSTVNDVDIGLPTVLGTSSFVNGEYRTTFILDTDAGATKTWIDGDQQTITIDVSNFGPLLANLLPLTFTINIIP